MTPTTKVLEGHQRIRSLLRGLVATAARAREGDIEAAMSLGSFVEEELLAPVAMLVDTMSAVERELPTERTDA